VDDLIEALTILRKYANPKYPTNCEHDELRVHIDPDLVSAEDKQRLEALGFTADDECFLSYVFGSC
jgi:hypothetical protein